MLSQRSQTQGYIHMIPLYKVQEQAKLIDGDKNQDNNH